MVWDYFISHSTEDKLAIAEPLAKYLVAAQFKIWYDDFSLKLGDSLLASIDEGLAGSRFGIVILSEKFFAKRWPKSELAGLVATEGNRKRILPVWHNISAAAVAEHSPILADRKAIDSSRGLQAVSKAIVQASFPEREKNLPLQFHDESASELNEARGRFRALLEGGAQVADLRAFLSVNHDLLLKLGGYSSVLIPGFALSPSIFDFAILRPHGVTGPIDLELVTIGPLDRRDVDSTLRTITEQLGESSRSPEKPRNYGGGPTCRGVSQLGRPCKGNRTTCPQW